MYNILCKNDKLARVILVKMENPIEKCQATGYIIFLARACQYKTHKIGITFYHFSSSRYLIYKMVNIQKALI